MEFSDYIASEVDYIVKNSNFTADEEDIFKALSKGKTILQVSMEVGLSLPTVNRRIKRIKQKIKKLK